MSKKTLAGLVFILSIAFVGIGQTTMNPSVGSTNAPHARITKIDITRDATKVTIEFTEQKGGYRWVKWGSDIYMRPKDGYVNYHIQNLEGKYELDQQIRTKISDGVYTFVLVFPKIDVGIETIDIIEPTKNGFRWENVNITNPKPSPPSNLVTSSNQTKPNGETDEAKANIAKGTDTYDRFTDLGTHKALITSKQFPIPTTYVELFEFGVKDYVRTVVAAGSYKGQTPTAGGLKSVSLEVAYLNYFEELPSISTKVYLLAGGERFEIIADVNGDKILRGPRGTKLTVGSLIKINIPLNASAQSAIYRAEKAEVKVGESIIDLGENDGLKRFREFYELVSANSNSPKSEVSPATQPKQYTIPHNQIKRITSFLEVTSDQYGFLDKVVKTNGEIGIADSYIGKYRDAKATHFAFVIYDKGKRTSAGFLYMKRGNPLAEELRREILGTAAGGVIASIAFVILPDRFDGESSIFTAELLSVSVPEP